MRNIFISHHQDQEFASTLKQIIHDLFPGHFNIDVAPNTFSLGKPWLPYIVERLSKTNIFIALCSPGIDQHSWIWFESGIAYAREERQYYYSFYG